MVQTPDRQASSADTVADEELRALVRADEGLISRRIFADQAIYEQELEKVFAHCWLYLGHDSQIPHPGDYFTTYMGEDHVIVTRDSQRRVRAFLNSCRHRGMRVCRTERGSTKTFLCPYHGWSYNVDGKLTGVPKHEVGYGGQLNREEWGLIEVAQLDTFGGLIFATWDPQAPTLREYLGDLAFYLDFVVNRSEGGVEAVGGLHKWVIPTNWKIATESALGDAMHVPLTHGSLVEIGLRYAQTDNGHQIIASNGHGFTSEANGLSHGAAMQSPGLQQFIADVQERASAKYGAEAWRFAPLGVCNLFPNLAILDTPRFRMFRVAHPRGPHSVEFHSYCLIDRALPAELRDDTIKAYITTFGPSGMFEQEDGEIWGEIQSLNRGFIARQQYFNYQLNMRPTRPVADVYGGNFPGQISGYWSEAAFRAFYAHWLKVMTA